MYVEGGELFIGVVIMWVGVECCGECGLCFGGVVLLG